MVDSGPDDRVQIYPRVRSFPELSGIKGIEQEGPYNKSQSGLPASVRYLFYKYQKFKTNLYKKIIFLLDFHKCQIMNMLKLKIHILEQYLKRQKQKHQVKRILQVEVQQVYFLRIC